MAGFSDRLKSAGEQLSTATVGLIPSWMVAAGVLGWLIVGVAGAFYVGAWFFSASASITIPLILAMVIGMVAYPLCDFMTDRGINKSLAAAIVLVGLLGIVGLVIYLTFEGVVTQLPLIQQQLQAGLNKLFQSLSSLGINSASIQSAIQDAQNSAADGGGGPLVQGLIGSLGAMLSAGISGLFSFAFGVFIAVTLLYYVLSDFPKISTWLGEHMGGLPVDIGEGIVEDAVAAMRGYFRGTTISGFVVAIIISLSMFLMGVPLAIPVGLVTFLTCYIPYFGAIFSGAFAFLVALGAVGLNQALVLLVVVLVTQNVLQTVINARAMGDSLNLHPLVVLVVTMLGGIFGGLLGAALGAPLAALGINAGKRLSDAFGDRAANRRPAAEADIVS